MSPYKIKTQLTCCQHNETVKFPIPRRSDCITRKDWASKQNQTQYGKHKIWGLHLLDPSMHCVAPGTFWNFGEGHNDVRLLQIEFLPDQHHRMTLPSFAAIFRCGCISFYTAAVTTQCVGGSKRQETCLVSLFVFVQGNPSMASSANHSPFLFKWIHRFTI